MIDKPPCFIEYARLFKADLFNFNDRLKLNIETKTADKLRIYIQY